MSARVPRQEEGPGFPWYLLTGLVLGAILGLAYSWFLSPVRYQDASPALLQAGDQDFYRRLVALAYRQNQDPGRALARLHLLGEGGSPAALEGLAERAASGAGPAAADETRALLDLAEVLRNPPAPRPTPMPAQLTAIAPTLTASPTPTETITVTASITPTLTRTPANQKTRAALTAAAKVRLSRTPTAQPPATETPGQPAEAPTETAAPPTNTPRPSATASPTLGAPFALAERKPVCDAGLAPALLQVQVEDAAGQPLPGVAITVLWGSNGQDRFFTGLAPEISPGYADFVMAPGETYSVRAGDNGETISDVTAPDCNGGKANGGIYLRFRQ